MQKNSAYNYLHVVKYVSILTYAGCYGSMIRKFYIKFASIFISEFTCKATVSYSKICR